VRAAVVCGGLSTAIFAAHSRPGETDIKWSSVGVVFASLTTGALLFAPEMDVAAVCCAAGDILGTVVCGRCSSCGRTHAAFDYRDNVELTLARRGCE